MQNPSLTNTKPRAAAVPQPRELSFSFILLLIVCACVLAAGFFFAAQQHFTSMDYGMKNSKLREQLRNLEAEKRRLLLAREVASSPLALRKAAREMGLREATGDVAAVPAAARGTSGRTTAPATPVTKIADVKAESPRVVRTVLTAPTESKPSGETRGRVVEAKKEKKEKTEVATLLKLR